MAMNFESNWLPSLTSLIPFFLLLGYWQLGHQHNKTQTQIQQLDRKIERLFKHLQVQPDELLEACREMKKSQGPIAAIQHYRTQTGASLKAAKDEIDAL
jgi:septal ring factor EnvC (AmiA/AmiB activator)